MPSQSSLRDASSPRGACPLSLLRSQLPQRGSHWQAGSLSTGRLRPDKAQKGGPCYRGQRLLDNAPCQAVAGLDSGALPFPRHRALLVQTKADRHARGSPSGGAGAKRLRGQARRERTAHAAISRLFVRAMLSPRPRITVSILALSVTPAACHCPGCGSQRLLRSRSHPAGRGPNSSSLFPPLAAVVAVAPRGRGFVRTGKVCKKLQNPLANFPEMRYNTFRGKSAENRISASLAQSVRAPDC